MGRDTGSQADPGSPDDSSTKRHAVSELTIWQSLRDYPSFRTLFLSTLGTNSGFWMWNIAIGWLALQLTDSPFFVGLVGFMSGIPTLLFGPFGGVLIDRFARKSILLIVQAIIACNVVIISLLLFADLIQPWQLLVSGFLNGLCMSLVFPTRSAMVANLVPKHHLANAIALNAAGLNSTRVIGPALAGPLIAVLGTDGTFAVCAALQIYAFAVSNWLPWHPPAETGVGFGIFQSMRRGFGTLWQSDYLLGLFFLAAVPTLCLMPFVHLMPVFARDVLGIGSTGLGILMAVNGLGAVLGSLFVAGSRTLPGKPFVLVASSGTFATVLILFSLTPIAFLAAIFILIAGFSGAVFLAVNNTLIQLHVDDAVRGRILGIYGLTWGLMPLGTLPAGAIAGAVSAPVALITLSSVAIVLITIVALRFPTVRQSLPQREQPADAAEPRASS